MKVYLLFNKYTNKFICFTSDVDLMPKDNFLIKEVTLDELGVEGEEFNLARFVYEGDYETGRIVDMFAEKKAKVTEEEVNKKYLGILFRKYPIDKLLYMVSLIAAGLESPDIEDFKKFVQVINAKKAKEIDFYEKSPNHIYETNKDLDGYMATTFATTDKK